MGRGGVYVDFSLRVGEWRNAAGDALGVSASELPPSDPRCSADTLTDWRRPVTCDHVVVSAESFLSCVLVPLTTCPLGVWSQLWCTFVFYCTEPTSCSTEDPTDLIRESLTLFSLSRHLWKLTVFIDDTMKCSMLQQSCCPVLSAASSHTQCYYKWYSLPAR